MFGLREPVLKFMECDLTTKIYNSVSKACEHCEVKQNVEIPPGYCQKAVKWLSIPNSGFIIVLSLLCSNGGLCPY